MENHNSKLDIHVAIFAFPFGTHAAPLLNITRKLASNSPNTIFSFFNTSNSNNLIFSRSTNDHENHKLGNIRVYDIWDGKPKGYVFKGNPQEEIELFVAAAPAGLRVAVAEAEAEIGRPVTCMVGDAFLWFVAEMAKEKEVPWVVTWPGPQHDLSIHFHTDVIRETIGVQEIAESRKEEVLDFIPGMSKIRVRDLPQGIVLGNLESFFSQMLHKVGREITKANAICINSCEELSPAITNDLKSKFPPKLLCLGPYNLIMPSNPCLRNPDESNCLDWLEKQEANSVAYVSFGSIARPSPSEIVALAQGLEASGVKFLWSLKDNLKVHLPDGFMETNKDKGKIVPWAPQTDVLAHNAVGVFITHFGYNSIVESITAQVPMIGRPLLGEQKLNGRFVEAVWGIGEEIEGGIFTKDGLAKSLDRVLWGEEGMKMKENIKGLKELIDKALGPQGSCNNNFLQLLNIVTN